MNLRKTYTFLALFCYSNILLSAGLQDPATTRMKAISGAGVASQFINGAVMFNPASIISFSNSTILYEKSNVALEDRSPQRTENYEDGFTETLIVTDTSSRLKGGFGYHYQNLHEGKRKQFMLSSASHIGKGTGMGFSVRHNEEESTVTNTTYTQFTFGLNHITKEGLSLGMNIIDFTQARPEYFSYRVGFQYTINSTINIIGDIGSGDVENFNKEAFNMAAIQLQVLDSLFLRAGRYHDKRLNRSGNSFGFGWTGPKLSLEYAVKSAELISEKADTILTDDKTLETSIGLTAIF